MFDLEMLQTVDNNTFIHDQSWPVELAWLLRFCTGLTGDLREAEDLAQETITIAWLRTPTLNDPAKRQAWLAAIARNRWRDWLRHRQKTKESIQNLTSLENIIHSTKQLNNYEDPESNWERSEERNELNTVVEKALAILPPATRTALVLHFIEDRPVADIAAQFHTTPSAISMRLQRGKAALKSFLEIELNRNPTGDSSSRVDIPEITPLKKTRIWCPYCGRAYLEGRFVEDRSGIELRCPHCNSQPDEWVTRSRNLAHIIKGVNTFKPAWTRISRSVHLYFSQVLPAGRAICTACGQPAHLWLNLPGPTWAPPSLSVQTRCSQCPSQDSESLETLVLSSPEGQAFWTAHPRIAAQPVYQVERDGKPVYVKEFTSVGETAKLVALFDVQTLALWKVYQP